MLLNLNAQQPGHLTFLPVDLLLDGLQLLGMPLVRGSPRLGQVVKLRLALRVLLGESLHLRLQPGNGVRVRLRTLRGGDFCQKKSQSRERRPSGEPRLPTFGGRQFPFELLDPTM